MEVWCAGASLLKKDDGGVGWGEEVGGGLALFLGNFFKVYPFYIGKLLYKVIISCRTPSTSANISSRHQPASAADIWCVLQLMMTLMHVEMHVWQVVVLPRRRLVRPAADDEFVKLLYSLQNYVMHLKKNYFFLLL